jgi:uncharacterized protein YeaO (DUF488 family)
MIRLKRVYESPDGNDGIRVLVERLWPRGITKERAAVDLWLREIAPSTGLRKWFGHDPDRWDEFSRRYREELRDHGEAIHTLAEMDREGTVTFVYAAHDEEQNSAALLKQYIEEMLVKREA